MGYQGLETHGHGGLHVQVEVHVAMVAKYIKT